LVMTATSWLPNALCLIDKDAEWHTALHTLELRDGRIVAVHDAAVQPNPGDTVIDATGRLVIPGLVNAHTHSPDNLIRGSAPNLPLEIWSLHSAAGRERRTPREITLSAQLGCIEMLRTGTTTVLDHIRFSPDMDAEGLDAVALAYQQAGLRATIAPVVADRAVADTMPLTEADLDGVDIAAYGRRATLPAREQIGLVEAFVARWHGDLLRCAVGPSGPQRCSDGLLEAAGDLSLRHDIIFHMHLLETRAQRAMGFRLYGTGMVAHLERLGVLSRRANLVHAIWLEDGDLDRIAQSGAAIVHNPVSNARLGSGIFCLRKAIAHGVRLALGTDSAACNDSNNLLETTKWATLLHNLSSGDPDDWISPCESLRLATSGGAGVLGLSATGRIAAGQTADLVLLKLNSPAFVPLLDPVRQLVQSENGAAVDTVIVAGRVLLRDGRCTTLDEAAIWEEARALAAKRLRDNRDIYQSAAALDAPIRRMNARIAAHRGCCAP